MRILGKYPAGHIGHIRVNETIRVGNFVVFDGLSYMVVARSFEPNTILLNRALNVDVDFNSVVVPLARF